MVAVVVCGAAAGCAEHVRYKAAALQLHVSVEVPRVLIEANEL